MHTSSILQSMVKWINRQLFSEIRDTLHEERAFWRFRDEPS